MRRIGGFQVTPAYVKELLGCTAPQARRLLTDLDRLGYIITSEGEHWEATVKGKALASATAAKPLRRATVGRLISELLERVREVNKDDLWAYRVDTVAVFGSVVTAKLRPNDIDIACRLRPRWQDAERQRTHEDQRRGLRQSRFANRRVGLLASV
jgi:hypothetical protein